MKTKRSSFSTSRERYPEKHPENWWRFRGHICYVFIIFFINNYEGIFFFLQDWLIKELCELFWLRTIGWKLEVLMIFFYSLLSMIDIISSPISSQLHGIASLQKNEILFQLLSYLRFNIWKLWCFPTLICRISYIYNQVYWVLEHTTAKYRNAEPLRY